MATTPPSMQPRLQLGKAIRESFVAELFQVMEEIVAVVQVRLNDLLDEAGSVRDTQARRDQWTAFKKSRPLWIDQTRREWRARLNATALNKAAAATEFDGMELVDTGVVETRLIASKLALAIAEAVLAEFDDLRVRMKALESLEDLASRDMLRVEGLVHVLVDQWVKSGMSVAGWHNVNAVVQRVLVERLLSMYQRANATLIGKGVLPVITLKDRVKVPPRAPGRAPEEKDKASSTYPQTQFNSRLPAPAAPHTGPQTDLQAMSAGPSASGTMPVWRPSINDRHGLAAAAAEETRMLTATTPLARARSRAQGVIGQIRRLFVAGVGNDFAGTVLQPASPALSRAISPQATAARYAASGTLYQDYSPVGVARVADDLRERTVELKAKAETKSEKAIIEIVALMFQAILAEERIPPNIRVWFARLQMPVLRVALEDAEFLGAADHPARALIDRMGSCVMGFDASGVQGVAMEAEVKRIVQVIEQYPETGKKVYQIVYDEFQKFLGKFLSEKGATKQVISVAQQVEQKETLAIQYTIEMRNMLKDLPVRDEIRDYLFKVWAEVLAVCALRKGPQHQETLSLKACATDLVWAASAKPNRADRTRVIQDLPNLLVRLRAGMTLLAMAPTDQENYVKKISDTLADAFLSKTQAIPQAKIDAMARRLANLEEFVSEDGMGDLPLDSESLEMMLGMDAAPIEVVNTGGSKPNGAMIAWANELQLGTWYVLEYNRQTVPVQFAWHSKRRHLNLFAATTGRSYLIQGGRLGAYLQSGLLVPQEDEALTVRATRDALAKLEANPDMLLS